MPEDPRQFIARLKAKYPEYKDWDDNVLLSKVSQKFPEYRDVANTAFGSIQRPSALQEALGKTKTFVREKGTAIAGDVLRTGLNTASAVGNALYPSPAIPAYLGARPEVREKVNTAFEQTLEPLQRPYKAVQAVAAGKEPITPLLKPTEQPSFGNSAVDALRKYGLTDTAVMENVGGAVGYALDLLIGSLPLGAARTKVATQVLTKAGVPTEVVPKVASEVISNFEKSPVPINLRSVRAALKNPVPPYGDGKIFVGNRGELHVSLADRFTKKGLDRSYAESGFIINGKYYDRKEALALTKVSNELVPGVKTTMIPGKLHMTDVKWSLRPDLIQPNVVPAPAVAPRPTAVFLPYERLSSSAFPKPLELTLYRGTGKTPVEIYGKDAVEAGRAVPLLGKASYYAHTLEEASMYGNVARAEKVALKNPLKLTSDVQWSSLLREADVPILHSTSKEQLLNPKGVEPATQKLQEFLKGKGYDSVIVSNTAQNKRLGESFGHDQVIKFEQPQAISKVEKALAPEQTMRMLKMQHQKLKIQARQQATRERFAKMPDEELIAARTEGEQKLEQIANLKEVLRERAIQVGDVEDMADESVVSLIDKATKIKTKGLGSNLGNIEPVNPAEMKAAQAELLKRSKKAAAKQAVAHLEVIDEEIAKRVNTFYGQEGSVYIPSATEALTNLHGTAIKGQRKLGKLARNVGVPHMVGEFHPEFKPVFWGLHNGAGRGHEKWLDALDVLSRKEQFALPATSKTRLANLFKVAYDQGRTSGTMQRLSTADLQSLKATPAEIKAYNAILDYNNFVGDVQIEKLRVLRGFDTASQKANANNPEYLKDLQKFNNEIEQAVKARGPGYFSTKRLTGDWVVYRPDPDYFFNRFETKFAAEQKAKQLPGSSTFIAEEVDPSLSYGFSSHDLESLISDTGLSKNSAEMQALLKELNSRTVASYWLEKQFKEGFDFNWDNIMEVALDYGARVTSSYGRSLGTKAANTALSAVSGRMSPQLNAYARNLIDSFGVGGGRNWSALSRIIYTSELALDTKNAVINFVAQPLQTLAPDLGNYFKGVLKGSTEVDAKFIEYNDKVNKHVLDLIEGKPSSLDFRTQGIITQLGREGELGKRVYRQMMGMHGMRNEHISDFLGSFQTGTEYRNRALAAIAYSDIGQTKLGLKTFPELYQFVKQKVAFTNYLYDYYNKPMILQKAKNIPAIGPALNTMYIFRHYLNNYVHTLAYQTMKGKPEAAIRSWTNLMAVSGLKGLPFAAISGMVYAKATGKTPEFEMRKIMTDNGIPPEFQELLITGLPSLGGKGVDISMSAGLGDIIPSYGDMFENVVGVSASAVRRILTGVQVYLETGDADKAAEYAPMKAIRSVAKMHNALKRGVTTKDGTQVMKVTPMDAFWMATGFTPASLAKAYAERQAKTAFTTKLSNNKELFARRLAMARADGNAEKAIKIRMEARKAGVKVSSEAVRNWRNKFSGRQERPAKEVRRRVRMIEKAFA